MLYLIGLEGSDDSSNDVRGIFQTTNYLSKGYIHVTETKSQQLPCLEVFKQVIVSRGFLISVLGLFFKK